LADIDNAPWASGNAQFAANAFRRVNNPGAAEVRVNIDRIHRACTRAEGITALFAGFGDNMLVTKEAALCPCVIVYGRGSCAELQISPDIYAGDMRVAALDAPLQGAVGFASSATNASVVVLDEQACRKREAYLAGCCLIDGRSRRIVASNHVENGRRYNNTGCTFTSEL
jgi:hypothetical protein